MGKKILKRIIPRGLWHFAKIICFRGGVFFAGVWYSVWGAGVGNTKSIPIIICNYNRLSFLKRLIESLTKRGYYNIHIIDNNSSYKPLLDYYLTCPWDVIRLADNIGYTALWDTDVYKRFKNSYYVYTDADMEIDESCPDDFLEHFLSFLKGHPFCQKVGFGLKLTDIPDSYALKSSVILEESPFWTNEITPGFYRAKIDTTFALYRPYCKGPASDAHLVFRTGFPYLIKHLPWYVDSSNMDVEEKYYMEHIERSTQWSCRSVD